MEKYLRETVAKAPEEFVRTKQLWRLTAAPNAFPVYRTTGDPFVVFTVGRDAIGETIVVAMHFGRKNPRMSFEVFERELWSRIIEPRLTMLAEGGPWLEQGKPA